MYRLASIVYPIACVVCFGFGYSHISSHQLTNPLNGINKWGRSLENEFHRAHNFMNALGSCVRVSQQQSTKWFRIPHGVNCGRSIQLDFMQCKHVSNPRLLFMNFGVRRSETWNRKQLCRVSVSHVPSTERVNRIYF